MTIKTRKELVADIKRRVTAGVSKSAIFSRYSMTEWEEAALWVTYPNSDYSDAPLTLRGYESWRSVSVASDKSELHLEDVRGQSPAAGLISTQRCRGAESAEERVGNQPMGTVPDEFMEYYWGEDLSGSEHGAGGVGGLLAVSYDGEFYVPIYGGNGNIMGYVGDSGAFAVKFEYDPYGDVISIVDVLSAPMPSPDGSPVLIPVGLRGEDFSFGFSTKYHDREVGLIAYQLRSYSPTLGRWLNRDPIEEEGGENLYGFIKNAEGALFDILGEYTLHDAMISLQNRHIPKKGWVKVGFPCDPDMWTVCYNPELYHVYTDEQIFEEWLRLEVNDMSWTNNLPACPKCLVFKGGKPVSPGTEWSEPKKVFNAKKFHPNAVWEIRTAKPLKNGAGNQCTYDSSGNLITDEFGSGTADRSQAPGETGAMFQLLFNYGHIAHDVEPFELALDLDGGTHGSHVRQYISVRPFIME